jgi:hypothetical protein
VTMNIGYSRSPTSELNVAAAPIRATLPARPGQGLGAGTFVSVGG